MRLKFSTVLGKKFNFIQNFRGPLTFHMNHESSSQPQIKNAYELSVTLHHDKAEARSVYDEQDAALTMTAGMKQAERSQAKNGQQTITLQKMSTQLCDNCMRATRHTYRRSQQAEQRNAIDDRTSTAASARLRDDSYSRNKTCREEPRMELTIQKMRSQTMHTGGRHGMHTPARTK